MRNFVRSALTALVLASAPALFVQGCATTSSAPAQTGPVELDGTKWKLVVAAGKMDGRVITFKKESANGYTGYLTEPGQALRNIAGVDSNTWLFKLTRKSDREFDGTYRQITRDGSFAEREVLVSIDGNNLNWNLESAAWERQD